MHSHQTLRENCDIAVINRNLNGILIDFVVSDHSCARVIALAYLNDKDRR